MNEYGIPWFGTNPQKVNVDFNDKLFCRETYMMHPLGMSSVFAATIKPEGADIDHEYLSIQLWREISRLRITLAEIKEKQLKNNY